MYGGDPCCPKGPGSSEPSVVYPSFHYTGSEELGIAKEGAMTVKYKVVSTEESDRNGKHKYECTVEVHEIVSAKGEDDDDERPARSNTSAADALDALMKAAVEQHESGENDADEAGE